MEPLFAGGYSCILRGSSAYSWRHCGCTLLAPMLVNAGRQRPGDSYQLDSTLKIHPFCNTAGWPDPIMRAGHRPEDKRHARALDIACACRAWDH